MIASLVPVPAEGGFNPLDVNTGSFFWTLVIFVIALPFMWKVVFGPITAALYARDAQASEAAQAAQKARDEAAQDRARVEVALELVDPLVAPHPLLIHPLPRLLHVGQLHLEQELIRKLLVHRLQLRVVEREQLLEAEIGRAHV